MRSLATLLAASALLLSGCQANGDNSSYFVYVQGNGVELTEARMLTEFDRVDAYSMLDVSIHTGAKFEVEVTCDENLLEIVETRVTGRTLEIRFPRGTLVDTRLSCRARVTAPRFTALQSHGSGQLVCAERLGGLLRVQSSGSGDVDIAGMDSPDRDVEVESSGSGALVVCSLKAQSVSVAISGSGGVWVAGATQQIDLESTGSGGVQAQGLPAQEVEVVNHGSGQVEVHASEYAGIELSGSGDVVVHGNPVQIDTDTSGSGQVIQP